MRNIVIKRPVLTYADGVVEHREDQVVTEYPLTIFLNEEEFATLVCTPEHLEQLTVGFLASEGVITSFGDIKSLLVEETRGLVHVETNRVNALSKNLHSKRYLTSCCGKSRQSFYFYNDAKTAKKITARRVTLTYQDCFALMKKMQGGADIFRETGGVHNAALCDASGIILARMDIGRHNALDKIYGYCLQHEIALDDKVIVFSGRVSSEVLLKAAKIGCEIVLSKSAPTELALDLAEELGITVVGFIRNRSLNVYTHPERIRS
ncbi:formate dehydrogenase family accessory protein FdhD [Tumebacillus algifaecis]|uniref:Sulfur carrier protein FdhD n=1 Tax=Tumebacillus algifaecis TaxID=1214604 RepID=A0A223D1C8_9BACL|nr:formate dehydrogenase accessory sulfurtransferase FdhD [Tumebacillus algifaecis]ASS75253.1 formate dehydrogenase family accessory protein FdhD [Tumebacillus algifaecis]